jgi:hypothetical protein
MRFDFLIVHGEVARRAHDNSCKVLIFSATAKLKPYSGQIKSSKQGEM